MVLLTGRNLITPLVWVSPKILIVGFITVSFEPDMVKLPDNVVLPNKLLLPIWVVEPLIFKLPVNDVLPINWFEPEVNNEPVIIWFPLNVLEPVVANLVLSIPSNKSAFKA